MYSFHFITPHLHIPQAHIQQEIIISISFSFAILEKDLLSSAIKLPKSFH